MTDQSLLSILLRNPKQIHEIQSTHFRHRRDINKIWSGRIAYRERVVSAIKKAEEKGVIIVLATARPLQLVEHLFDVLNNKGLIILDNGAAIYDISNRSTVWESLIDTTTASHILSVAKKHAQEHGIGLSTREGRVNNPERILPSMHVRRINVRGLNTEQRDEFIKEIEKLEKNISITHPSSFYDKDLFDVLITNADATKQFAVLRLSEILEIPTGEMIGVGDHYNDFPLLMACGLKVAMGNAVPDLKAIADYIAPSVDEDGIADVIERFIVNPS